MNKSELLQKAKRKKGEAKKEEGGGSIGMCD